MKIISTLAFILILTINLPGQSIEVSDNLTLIQLTDNSYIHTCRNNNGMVFISGNEALIVSTPDSDSETQNLVDWITNELKVKIVGCVIDRWHPDAIEGIDIIHKNGIKTYAYELTRQIANDKGLPIPQNGFDPKTKIKVGNEKVICHYLGEAHTKDGIVVWIPSEQILFGGNEIRNYNGWVGNIADANLYSWSETAERVKKEYGSARIVVPGHGKHGGTELIDYTIELYKFDALDSLWDKQETFPLPTFKDNDDFKIKAESKSFNDDKWKLINAIIFTHDSTKFVKIESPLITYQPNENRIDSENGKLKIYDKTSKGGILRTDVSYKKLILFKKDDFVGLRIILKGIEK